MMKPRDLPEEIALFPLPGALLLPRSKLPLHIFEPRYLQMVEDCLATRSRLIGMVTPCSCQGRETQLSRIGCAGRITGFSETEDGRYMITLSGVSRFRLIGKAEAETPYIRGKVCWKDFGRDLGAPEDDPEFDRDEFMELLSRYFHAQGLDSDWEMICGSDEEFVINSLATLLPLTSEDKQALLEAPCLSTRREALVTLLEMGVRGGCEGGRQ